MSTIDNPTKIPVSPELLLDRLGFPTNARLSDVEYDHMRDAFVFSIFAPEWPEGEVGVDVQEIKRALIWRVADQILGTREIPA